MTLTKCHYLMTETMQVFLPCSFGEFLNLKWVSLSSRKSIIQAVFILAGLEKADPFPG